MPLVETATTLGVYPPLIIPTRPHRGVVHLWDFMTQAEIFVVLCVYLRSARRALGPSLTSLDFVIMAGRRPSDVGVRSVGQEEFVDRVELALVDNLQLPVSNIRRCTGLEWWVVIEDIASVDVPGGGNGSSMPAATGRRRSSTIDSTGDSSSRSISSNAESCTTPKRKVLLATPPPTSVATNVIPPALPTTTSSSSIQSLMAPLLPQTGGQDASGPAPVVSWTSPAVHGRPPSAIADRRYVAQRGAAAAPAANFAPPPSPPSADEFRAPVHSPAIADRRYVAQSGGTASAAAAAPAANFAAQSPANVFQSPAPGASLFRAPAPYGGGTPGMTYRGLPAPLPQRPPPPGHHISACTPRPSSVPSFAPVSLEMSPSIAAASAAFSPAQAFTPAQAVFYRQPPNQMPAPVFMSPTAPASACVTPAGTQL